MDSKEASPVLMENQPDRKWHAGARKASELGKEDPENVERTALRVPVHFLERLLVTLRSDKEC